MVTWTIAVASCLLWNSLKTASLFKDYSMQRMALLYLLLSLNTFAQTDFYNSLAHAAGTLTKENVVYDPSYFRISFPNGDVPPDRGVCTDVVIRAYRRMNIDLQKEVHEDMSRNFRLYPKKWGLGSTDPNIDHRRVPNLMMFLSRKGIVKPITRNGADYLPGDIVCWDLGKGITHIGIVSNRKAPAGNRNLIVHNIGGGQVYEDCLFRCTIIGHYRYRK